MLDVTTDRPPRAVKKALKGAAFAVDQASWARLAGGRTNDLWTFRANRQTLVCKLYDAGAATPLFPNDAHAEARALAALEETGLAPKLRAQLNPACGDVLIYEFVEATGPQDASTLARALRRLHDTAPPAGLRSLDCAPASVLAQADTMLSGLDDPRAADLQKLRPDPADVDGREAVFLHGDPVPANVVAARTGPCLIDWQCPALGDPTHDLAIYLCSAMQHLYGEHPLADAEARAFLNAYGHSDRIARYRHLAPHYHYRMAAYCLWKAAAGDAEYAVAADLEIAQMKQLGR